jgi:hypothetical protein
MRAELPAGDGELGPEQLGLPVADPYPVLQVRQVRRGCLPVGDCVAQRTEERPLQDGIPVGVLGQQPRRLGAVLACQRPAWPAPQGKELAKPAGVVLIDALPFRRDLGRKCRQVLPWRRGNKPADPLILRTPGEQFPPELFIHAASIVQDAERAQRGLSGWCASFAEIGGCCDSAHSAHSARCLHVAIAYAVTAAWRP